MDNPETLATLGTQDIGRQQQQKNNKKNHTTQKTKKMSNTDPTNSVVNPGSLRVKQFLPLIRHPPCHSCSQDVLDTTKKCDRP